MKQEKNTIIIALTALAIVFSSPARADKIEEAQLKSLMIFQLPFDVRWPQNKSEATKDVNVCIVGDSKIIDMKPLFDAASKKFGRNYNLTKKSGISALDKSCHIAYISDSESGISKADLAKLGSEGMLTISDIKGFAERGGMLEFVPVGNTMKIGVINRSAAQQANIFIAAGLLEMALKVIDG